MARTRISRRVAGGVVLVLAIVAGLTAGIATFAGLATVITSLPVLSISGLTVLAIAAVVLAQAGFRLLGTQRPWRAGLLLTGVLVVVVYGAAAATLFQPVPTAAVGPIPPDVRFWELPDGSRLAYVFAQGEGDVQPFPVVFLHGGPGTPGEGMPEAGRVLASAGFDVYAYDQLGAGRSTRLADVTAYTVARHVADLEAIRTAIDAEQLILVGRSWGATLAAAYLAAHPERVARAVFVSPGALWGGAVPDNAAGGIEERLTLEQRQTVEHLTSSPRILAAAGLLGINPNVAHALVPDAEADAFMQRIMLAEVAATVCPGHPLPPVHDNRPGFYVNQITSADAERVADPRPALRAVEVPALILRGTCDYIGEAVAFDYKETLPNSILMVMQDAGHAIANEQPALFAEILRAFLLDKPLPPSS